MMGNDIDKGCTPSLKVQASVSSTTLTENAIQDLGNTPSLGAEQDVQQMGRTSVSKPKVRPLAQKDPL
jgi:hypothetical protein